MKQLFEWSMKANASFFSAPYSFTTPNNNANYAVWSGTSNLGRINGQGVSQSGLTFVDNALKPAVAPNGLQGFELKLEGHYATTTLETSFDAIFDRGFAGDFTAIADFNTGRFYEYGVSTIVGGSGLFEGATGTVDLIQEGIIQVNIDGSTQTPQGNNGAFGFAKGTFTYHVELPGKDGLFTGIPKAEDRFVIDSLTGESTPRIAGFERRTDKFILDNDIFNPDDELSGVKGRPQAGSIQFIRSSLRPELKAIAGQPTLFYEQRTGLLSYDEDGRGPLEATPLAILEGRTSLTASNFALG